jgi:hypothetical protein
VATLYELLDVDPGATTAEVRAAYLVKARALHPDRHGGESAADMAVAQRRMQEVNAAWTVLSDPRGRREYDASLAASAARAASDAGPDTAPGAHPQAVPWERVELAPRAPTSAVLQLIRIGPVVLLLAVLGAIFVFTAFAMGGSSVDIPAFPRDDELPSTGDCIEVAAEIEVVSCDAPNSGRITAVEAGADAESTCSARGDVPLRVDDSAVLCVRPVA